MPDSNTIFEITSRTIQRRFLMRPSKEVNEIILGVIGRGLELYPSVELYIYVFMSNHFELLASAPDFGTISAFIGHLKSNIARELGAIHDWREKFWGRRFSSIPVLDEPALLGRVRYILEHGCKENLVVRPGDWPGLQCVRALTEGEPIKGYWYDRTAAYLADREGKQVSSDEFVQEYEVRLKPLPCWADLTEEARQAKFSDLVEAIEIETAERVRKGDARPLGRKRVLRQNPHDHPERPNQSPAPPCHAARRAVRRWYRRAYREFLEAYQRASKRFRSGRLSVEFPAHCFRPPLPYYSGQAFAPG